MLSSLTMTAAAPGNRVFYGFNIGSAEWADGGSKTYDCGFVSYPFDLSENGTVLKSYLDSPSTGAYAGAAKDGILYAVLYDYTTSTEQPTATNIVGYNIYNGTLEIVGQWNPEQTGFKPQDMTYDPVSDKIYALGYDSGFGGLYELDLNTAKFNLICETAAGGTLAADITGKLWTIDSSGVLYTFNTNENGEFTGRTSKVFDTGLSGMLQNQTMEFDYTTGKLYWASSTASHPLGSENVYLQEIDLTDLENITMTQVGRVGIMSRLVGMYIPSAENIDAPAAPTNITSAPGANGALEATISWVNPTTAFGGGEIGNLYGAVIKRDGVQVDYISATEPGKAMTWTDKTVPERGNYRYEIQLVNGKGNGAKGIAYQFVGYDKPAAVAHISGTVAENMKSITLTWEAPTTGAQLGSFDAASTRYKVTRNDGTVIAEDLTECTVTDNKFVRLMGYTYTISSINENGESVADSPTFILGPAVELPLEQTFENEAQMRNRWTILDGNNDTFTWMFYTNLGHSVFGDYEVCAEYIVSPTLGNSDDADEWLISPPLALEAGEEYEVTVSGRSYSGNQTSLMDEIVDIYFGNQNSRAAMTQKLGTMNISANETDKSTGTMAFKRSSVALPVMDEDATRCVGINLVSPLMTSGFLQINGIYIGKKGVYSGVADVAVEASDAQISLSGRTLTIYGEFNQAALYNLQGMRVATVNSAVVDLSGLAGGVYILNIDGKSFKLAL